MNVSQHISDLRKQLSKYNIDACLITGTDPHLSEYTPANWKTREWISGFTGSYGKMLITNDKSLLWTDTRYFLQAMEQLEGSEIVLMKERVLGAIVIEDWIIENFEPNQKVSLNGLTLSMVETTLLETKLAAKGIVLVTEPDLVDEIWNDRPIAANNLVYDFPLVYAGKSRTEKIEVVRARLKSKNIDATVVTMLDDIAWLFNLRGEEIDYTPLFSAYAYIDLSEAFLFIHPDKIPDVLKITLSEEGITILDYSFFYDFLFRIKDKHIQIDPLRTNFRVAKSLGDKNKLIETVSITTELKSAKDAIEISRIRNAHIKDGAAMVNSLYWLNKNIGKEKITEVSFGNKLSDFRREQDLFKGDSFHPIVGFGPHGAIVHYHATNQTDTEINSNNLLLIDSGGQYLDGTTDITRTVSFGVASEKQKEDFTFCLKAHIALATTVFPEGTRGYSLDAIARNPLWNKGINYGHGTGHGIGYFLSVHEGPMSIRTEYNNEPIREGNLISNEPGIYREGKYGIRIENVMFCKMHSTGEFGKFLCFETISLCPIDRHLINSELLSKDEIDWVNHYHELVIQNISPLLADREVLEWLNVQCSPLYEP